MRRRQRSSRITETARRLTVKVGVFLLTIGGPQIEVSMAQGGAAETQGGDVEFDIPRQRLGSALNAFALSSGWQVIASTDLTEGVDSPGVQGTYRREDGLRALLSGTGLTYRFDGAGMVTIERDTRSPMPPAFIPSQSQATEGEVDGSPLLSKPIKVPEVLVKDVRERPTWTTPVDGYKADHASTVTRSTMSIDETPVSIGVITRDMIRDTFSRTQGEAFEGVSGVSRAEIRQGRSEALSIRGFSIIGSGGGFSGLKANGLPTDGLWAPDWGIVERYEIVKGPASIVGGAANPGGIINRITKTPQRSNFTTVETNFGSYDFYRGLLDANGVLPKYEHIRGRLVFAVEEGGNFVDNSPVRQYTVAPSVEMDLFKNAGKLLLVGTYQTFDGANYDGWPLTTDGKILNVPRTRNFGGGAVNGARTRYTGYNSEAHYNHTFIHDIKLSIKGKYSNSHQIDRQIYSFTYSGIPPSGEANVLGRLQNNKWETYAGELFISKEFTLLDKKHELLAGVDYRDMTVDQLLTFTFLPSNSAPILDNVFNPRNLVQLPSESELTAQGNTFRTKLKQTGGFAQAVIRPVERLTLVFGGRYDRADASLESSFIPGIQLDQTKSAWTGRFGATYKLTSWMNIYGGLQQSFDPQIGFLTRNRTPLDPETGINYEVGAKLNFFEDRLRLTTAMFRTYRRNVATLDPEDPGFTIAIGEQRHQGIELDVNGQPIPGWNLNTAFTYLDAVITEDNTPGFAGSYPIRVPRAILGRVFTTYQVQSGPLQGFGFGGGVYFQGGSEVSLPNTFKTDPYQRVDALLFYRGDKRYDVTVNIRNLLNATYIEAPSSLAFANRFGAPITAIASLRVYF